MIHDLCEDAGITYRQLDYWCRKGWINGTYVQKSTLGASGGGSGSRRTLDEQEYQVAIYMGRLVNAGLDPAIAADAARNIVTSRYPTVRIAPRVTVTVWGGV